MNIQDQSLEALDNFFKRTSLKEIQTIIDKVDSMEFAGPTISEYFEKNIQFCLHFPQILNTKDRNVCPPPSQRIKIPKNTAPNFSGSFFLCNIAL